MHARPLGGGVMRGWLGLILLATACGGAAESDVFGQPTSAGTPTPSTTPPDGTTPPAPTATSPNPNPKPCTATTYYRDNDGDGFGGTVTQSACAPPGEGWVTKGGDCDDDNGEVFPGQQIYFDTAYSRSAGGHSFDYDCNAKEDQKPPVRKAASPCTLVGTACTGDGIVPNQPVRAGAGVDPLCGATEVQTCVLKAGLGTCDTKLTQLATPISCR